jgi:hypothetical protein
VTIECVEPVMPALEGGWLPGRTGGAFPNRYTIRTGKKTLDIQSVFKITIEKGNVQIWYPDGRISFVRQDKIARLTIDD